jgi:hypothetical protein
MFQQERRGLLAAASSVQAVEYSSPSRSYFFIFCPFFICCIFPSSLSFSHSLFPWAKSKLQLSFHAPLNTMAWSTWVTYPVCRVWDLGGVGIAQWYRTRLRAGWSGVRVPAGAGNFSLHHRVQTGSGTHPDSFPGGKAAGSWSWLLTSI